MGNQFSHCGTTTAACFDVNDARMELRDSGEAPEQQPRAAPEQQPRVQARASPPAVGRNHSVQRSFGGSSPGTPRGGGGGGLSDADRMLEELRNMYSAASGVFVWVCACVHMHELSTETWCFFLRITHCRHMQLQQSRHGNSFFYFVQPHPPPL